MFHALRAADDDTAKNLAGLLAEPATLSAWNVTDRSSMRTGIDGSGAAPANGAPVGRLGDLKGARAFTSPSDSQRPLAPSLFDGVNDEWRIVSGPGGGVPSGDFVCLYRGTDTRGIVLPSQGVQPFVGVWQAGNNSLAMGSVSIGDLIVDGVSHAASTRHQLAIALADGHTHIIEARNVPFGQFEELRCGNYPNGYQVGGLFAPIAYLDAGHAEIAAARDAARSFALAVAEKLGP